MLCRRQRQRDRTTVNVPPRNYVMAPMQPANFNSVNSQYGLGYTPPSAQQFTLTPPQFSTTPPSQPTISGFVRQPSSITVPPTTLPNPVISSDGSDLDRMQQVQKLMIEIHRLESESREGNQQRIQELKQRVGELSGTEGRMPVPDFLQSPPAYDVKQGIGRPEYGAADRG